MLCHFRCLSSLIGACIGLLCLPLNAQNYWITQSNDNRHQNLTNLKLVTEELEVILTNTSQNETKTIWLPLPNEQSILFELTEVPIFETSLAKKYPNIKSYIGHTSEHPQTSCRISWTSKGLNALIYHQNQSYLIDPVDKKNYKVYNKNTLQKNSPADKILNCENIEKRQHINRLTDAPSKFSNYSNKSNSDGLLRTYRIAIATTGEYTQFHGGTTEDALSAIANSLNRVNSIFERELAIRFVLAENNEQIIYINPNTDPYSNGNLQAMIEENQFNLDDIIGNTHYDIGHVFGTSGGGVSVLASLCDPQFKAYGATAINEPIGDYFDMVYLAHELGHQLGAKHSFNGTSGQCNGNRHAQSAYEVGSGTTIMAYQGLCNEHNIGTHTDDYFHSSSLQQITHFVQNNPYDCANYTVNETNITGTNAIKNHIIPKSTPFVLNATNQQENINTINDNYLYTWEQMDLGSEGLADTASTNGPIFRSFPPSPLPQRIFPRLEHILSGNSCQEEVLPCSTRMMQFQLTKRNQSENGTGGAFNTYMTYVGVADNAGPLTIHYPNHQTTLTSGTSCTVSWDVANTSAPPVLCSHINIWLSTDGGYSFSTKLAHHVPNDGKHTVLLPDNLNSDSVRFKIEAANNIFFDISDEDLTIVPNNANDLQIVNLPTFQSGCENDTLHFNLTVNNINELSISLDSLVPNSQYLIKTIDNAEQKNIQLKLFNLPPNQYSSTLYLITENDIYDIALDYEVRPIVNELLLGLPEHLENNVPLTPSLSWQQIKGQKQYIIEIAEDETFSNLVQIDTLLDNHFAPNLLVANNTYFWRVSTYNSCADLVYSPTRQFTTTSTNELCSVTGNTAYEWIDKIMIGNFVHHSNNNQGYQKFTEQFIELQQGQNAAISLYPGFSDATYNEYWTIWLDTNLDGNYEANEKILDTYNEAIALNNIWTVPHTLAIGVYPLRIAMSYNSINNACSDLDYGEIEDYYVWIKAQDKDGDQIADHSDNCPQKFNPNQNDLDNNGIGDICESVELQMKVYLGAVYKTALNGMHTLLNEAGVLPLSQPYTDFYNGTESLNSIPPNMVDWVIVEARQGTPALNQAEGQGTELIERKAGILLSNGQIVSPKLNMGLLFFNLEDNESYYFLVRHRNHLDIITSIPLVKNEVIAYDFTTGIEQAFGPSQQMQSNSTIAAMIPADFNHDGSIQSTDYDLWKSDPAQLQTYSAIDANMDGTVQISDYNVWKTYKAKNGIAEIIY